MMWARDRRFLHLGDLFPVMSIQNYNTQAIRGDRQRVHQIVNQFFHIEEGEAKFVFGGTEEHVVKDGDAVIVPAGTYHNVINMSKKETLKLYTLYSPPNHPDGTIHKNKAEAEEAENQEHH